MYEYSADEIFEGEEYTKQIILNKKKSDLSRILWNKYKFLFKEEQIKLEI